jgi:glycerophosphoryl diester phosphodiesterase
MHRRTELAARGLALALVAACTGAAEGLPGPVVLAAHRGGIVEGIPENTLAAFRAAVRHGVRVIEIDLRATRDGGIVILHDATLDRTTNGRGPASEWSLAEVRKLDAGEGERVPIFEEVLAFARENRVQLLLDIKEAPGLDKRRVVRLIEQSGALLDVIVGPRSIEDLREFQRLNPNLRTLAFMAAPAEIEAFAAAGAGIIRLWPKWIHDDPTLIGRVHRLGRPVWTTAGDAPRSELETLIRLGVNGILGDRPEVLAALARDSARTAPEHAAP